MRAGQWSWGWWCLGSVREVVVVTQYASGSAGGDVWLQVWSWRRSWFSSISNCNSSERTEKDPEAHPSVGTRMPFWVLQLVRKRRSSSSRRMSLNNSKRSVLTFKKGPAFSARRLPYHHNIIIFIRTEHYSWRLSSQRGIKKNYANTMKG